MANLSSGTVTWRGLLGSLALLIGAPIVVLAQGETLFLDGFESGGVCWWSSAVGIDPPCSVCFGQPDGTPCGETIYSNCTSCSYSTPCDESGSQLCDCTVYACSAGSCQATFESCMRDCVRDTDGEICGVQGCGGGFIRDLCCSAGNCTQVCSTCYPL